MYSNLLPLMIMSGSFDNCKKENIKKEGHCIICGEITNGEICSNECREAYKDGFKKDEIRSKSKWILVKRKWTLKKQENL
jgi:predicted nucleic acid-binding Zn ribbon protein